MTTRFARGPWGSLTFVVSGCPVTVFLPENESRGWCLRIGASVYGSFLTRREAIENVGRYV